tara:strand:- start:132 stop:1430 length:1299 start_codon:yes stop_codon:yes gene_type:complete
MKVINFRKILTILIDVSLFLIVITFYFSYKIANIAILLLIVSWFLKKVFFFERLSFNLSGKLDKLIFLSYILFFTWHLIAVIFSENTAEAWKNVESKFVLLLFPIVLLEIGLSQKTIAQLLKTFIFSSAICTIYLLFGSFANYTTNGELLTYHDFTNQLNFHAVFYSYYVFLGLLLIVFFLNQKKLDGKQKGLLIFSLIILTTGLVVAASKNVMLVTLLIFIIWFGKKMLTRNLKLNEIGFLIVITVGSMIAIYQLESVKNRVVELTQLNGIENLDKVKNDNYLVLEDILEFNGTSLRLTLWYIGVRELDKKDSWLLGLTPGDQKQLLNAEFERVGIHPHYYGYNLHNQFVQTLVESGIVGLLIYLIWQLLYFIKSIKSRNYLLLSFIAAFFIFQQTESIIERSKGIVFFVFFLILLQQVKSEPNETSNPRY